MKTIKQHKLEQERANLLEKNDQLKAELQVLIDKSTYDNDHYTFSDDERGEQIGREIAYNARQIETISRKLEMYEVITDCYDAFYKRLKKEFDIKPQFKVGDKVRVRPNDTHSHFVKQYDNCIGKIVGEHHEYFVVIVTGAFQDQFLAEELQLIEETTGQDVTFQEGNKPQGKRILAECKWGDDGEPYYDVLHWHPTSGLKYPEGWYDQGGENVPDSVIKRFAEF